MNSTANLYNSQSSMDIAEGPTDDTNKKPEKRKNFVVRALLAHYGNTACNITAEQFEKEKYVIGTVKFNPIILMPAAVIIQFCCGSVITFIPYRFIPSVAQHSYSFHNSCTHGQYSTHPLTKQ